MPCEWLGPPPAAYKARRPTCGTLPRSVLSDTAGGSARSAPAGIGLGSDGGSKSRGRKRRAATFRRDRVVAGVRPVPCLCQVDVESRKGSDPKKLPTTPIEVIDDLIEPGPASWLVAPGLNEAGGAHYCPRIFDVTADLGKQSLDLLSGGQI